MAGVSDGPAAAMVKEERVFSQLDKCLELLVEVVFVASTLISGEDSSSA